MKLYLLLLTLILFLAPAHAMQQEFSESKTDSNSTAFQNILPTIIQVHHNLRGKRKAQHFTINNNDPEIFQDPDLAHNQKIQELVAFSLHKKVEDLEFIELQETNRSLRKKQPKYKTVSLFVQKRARPEVQVIINVQNS